MVAVKIIKAIQQRAAQAALGAEEEFNAGTISARQQGNAYKVFSYTQIIAVHTQPGGWFVNNESYSGTTSRHQGYVRRAWAGHDVQLVTEQEIEAL